MRMYDIIHKKRDGEALTEAEIRNFVEGYTSGDIPDYQAAALCMAIYFRGMNDKETLALTLAIRDSGDILHFPNIHGLRVDKHSTGGVGDKTSLVIAPIVASLGLKIAKMSGRGLGFTGGTIDKLESIPGFDTALSEEEFFDVVKSVGCAVIGQTANLAPADKKLYALRDVTGTVNSIPLICGSIMSKKLASGADTILLDVKYGSGAFMPDPESALELASKMVAIGTRAGKRIGALITDMEQPLSDHVGNALEIVGIIDVLNGKQNRLYNEIKEVAVKLLALTGKYDEQTAEAAFQRAIDSGEALAKFAQMVHAQHGDENYILHPELFTLGKIDDTVVAPCDGYVTHMVAADIGRAVTLLGGGRMQKGEPIDFSVGVVMQCQLGSKVKKGDVLCRVYHNGKNLNEAKKLLRSAIDVTAQPCAPHKIAYAYVDKNGVIKY